MFSMTKNYYALYRLNLPKFRFFSHAIIMIKPIKMIGF